MAWQPKGNIKGPPGPQGNTGNTGAQGPQGNPGTPGEVWFTGTIPPSGGIGALGDWYLNSTTGDFYEKTGSAIWTLRGNLKGPTGATGAQGPQGNTGAQGPQGIQGIQGPQGPEGPPGSNIGVTDGSDAAAGIIGEYIESVITGSVSIANSVYKTVTSINLTAGDWDVEGMVWFTCLANTTLKYIMGATDTSTTNSTDGQGISVLRMSYLTAANDDFRWPVPMRRYNLTATTNIKLNALTLFSGGGVVVCGRIRARRVR